MREMRANTNVWLDEESDIYTIRGVSESLDSDEISPFEEGFMNGYLAT